MAIIWRKLGLVEYLPILHNMREFIANVNPFTQEEIWLLEHLPIFTLGQAGKFEHILQRTDIPIIQTERGGQVTYHATGQLVGYMMLNLKQRGFSPRTLVNLIEQSIINLLNEYQIVAHTKDKAPGIYVAGKKIASIGLRIRSGWSFHGFALNVDMDLTPFLYINPCGYAGLQMTQMVAETSSKFTINDIMDKLQNIMQHNLDLEQIKQNYQ